MFLICGGVCRVLAVEPVDDHGLAVVGRSDQQEVGHALFAGPVTECFEPSEGLDGPGVADPAVRPDAPDRLLLPAGGPWPAGRRVSARCSTTTSDRDRLFSRNTGYYTLIMIGLPFAGDGLVHGLFMGVGIAVAMLFYSYEKRRRGLTDPRLWTVAGFAIAFGAIGSRLLTWDFTRESSLEDWWTYGDRSILAGLVGAWLGVHLGKRLTGYGESTGDLFAPSVALAMSIGRIGCLLTEMPGTPTGGSWGIVLTSAQSALLGGPAGAGLHPSFAYEIVFQATAFAVMWRFRDRLPHPGDLFICYVAAYAVFRFGVEFVRGNEVLWLGMSRPQWFLLLVLPLLIRRVWRVFSARGSVQWKGSLV